MRRLPLLAALAATFAASTLPASSAPIITETLTVTVKGLASPVAFSVAIDCGIFSTTNKSVNVMQSFTVSGSPKAAESVTKTFTFTSIDRATPLQSQCSVDTSKFAVQSADAAAFKAALDTAKSTFVQADVLEAHPGYQYAGNTAADVMNGPIAFVWKGAAPVATVAPTAAPAALALTTAAGYATSATRAPFSGIVGGLANFQPIVVTATKAGKPVPGLAVSFTCAVPAGLYCAFDGHGTKTVAVFTGPTGVASTPANFWVWGGATTAASVTVKGGDASTILTFTVK